MMAGMSHFFIISPQKNTPYHPDTYTHPPYARFSPSHPAAENESRTVWLNPAPAHGRAWPNPPPSPHPADLSSRSPPSGYTLRRVAGQTCPSSERRQTPRGADTGCTAANEARAPQAERRRRSAGWLAAANRRQATPSTAAKRMGGSNQKKRPNAWEERPLASRAARREAGRSSRETGL